MRETTWRNIGTDVSTETTVSGILTAAGLDYTVEKQPIFLANGAQIPKKCATVKSTGTPIGVVGDNYEIYQNDEAFGFVADIPNIQFEKAGETATGMVYIIGKLPELKVLNDSFVPYVIFQTSHNGRYNVRATICPLRIVCQNQFAYSFKQVRNTIDIRHSRQLPSKVAQAQALLRDTATYMAGFTNTAEELAMLKIGSKDNFYAIVDRFFDSTRELSERQARAIESQREFFIQCYNADDNANFTGTAWGVVNAFSDFTTHREVKKTKTAADSKFMSVTFDPNIEKLLNCIRAQVAA